MRANELLITLLAGLFIVPSGVRAGQAVCPSVADNSIASYPSEMRQNVGGRSPVKIKGRENMLLIKFDLSAVPRDAVITSATLRLKLAGPKFRLRQVGVSTISTDWIEGPDRADGEHDYSCFMWPGPRTATWAGPGSTICDVIFGNGGSIGSYTFARPEADGWWAIDVDPRIVAAMRADSFGLVVQDETGMWAPRRVNIPVEMREKKRFAPTLTVTWGPPDRIRPSAVTGLRVSTDGLEDGQVLLEFASGGDDGDRGTALGYEIRYLQDARITRANWQHATLVPRWQTPRPRQPAQTVRAWITGLQPGAAYSFGVVAYDKSGNRSDIASIEPVRLPGPTPPPRLRHLKPLPLPRGSALVVADKMGLWAADELSRVDPVTGNILVGDKYVAEKARAGSHVWDGQNHTVKLTALRGEVVAFNLVIEALQGALKGIRVKPKALRGPGGASIPADRFKLHRVWYLRSKNRYYGEATPPLDRPLDIPAKDNKVVGQKNQSVYVDLYVPHGIPAGIYRGTLQVRSSGVKGAVNVQVEVLDLDMPDELSFVIELNSYGWRGSREDYYAMHRLAHLHRLSYNVLSYGHCDSVSVPFLPKIEGEGAQARVVDWSPWDTWMGPLLDGSAFADLPRGPVPIAHFYLPFHENYPAKIAKHYAKPEFFRDEPKGPDGKFDYTAWKDYVAEHDVDIREAFDKTWHETAAAVAKQWREHLIEKGWTKTEFQIFCNNKHYFRNPKKGRNYYKATSLWTLDEPSYGRDFRALGYIYRVFRDVLAGDPLNVVCRGDISRPQWQGDRLDGVSDLSVVSGAFYKYQTIIQRRRVLYGDRYWKYGGGLGPTQDNAGLVALYVKNWTLGADGGLAYWTSFGGSGDAWNKPVTLRVVHLKGGHGYRGPVATTRLKAQRRAEQDIELMNMLARQPGWSRNRVARAVAAAVNLASKTEARGADDPGRTRFRDVHVRDLARIRYALAKEILAAQKGR